MNEDISINSDELLKIDEHLQFTLQRRELDIYDPSKIQFYRAKDLLDPNKYSSFFKLKSVTKYGKNSASSFNSVRKLFSYFTNNNNSFVFIIKSSKAGFDFNIGTIKAPHCEQQSAEEQKRLIINALNQTNYGIEYVENSYEKIALKDQIIKGDHIASITGIPGLYTENNIKHYGFIDEILNSLDGEEFTILGIFEPIPLFIIDELILRCNKLRTEISVLSKVSIQTGQSISLSKSFSKSYSNSEGYSYGSSDGVNEGYSFSPSIFGSLIGGVVGAISGGTLGAWLYSSIGNGLLASISENKSKNYTKNENHCFNKSETTTTGEAITKTESQNITKEVFNKSVERTEEILKSIISRFEIAKERGFWNTGLYIFSKDSTVLRGVANSIKTNISGEGSRIEPIRVLIFDKNLLGNSFTFFKEAILHLRIPRAEHIGHPLGQLFESVSTPLTGSELPIIFNFPQNDIRGVNVVRKAKFLPEIVNELDQGFLELGNISDMPYRNNAYVTINPANLVKHTFICGTTGSGKTITCINILNELNRKSKNIKYLVVEPAKSHYRNLYSTDNSELRIYTLGTESQEERVLRFRFNPFHPVRYRFQDKYYIANLQSHIDYIKAAIIASLPMEAAMPALLSNAITRSYIEYGWDIPNNKNIFCPDIETLYDITDYIPSFYDVRKNIDVIVKEKGFDFRLQSDYIAALISRIDGLIDGGKGALLNSRSHIEVSELLQFNTILELDNIADFGEKAMIMAFILASIYEYRKIEKRINSYSNDLKHVTLIEEAHHLLSNISITEDQEKTSPRSFFNQIFANMLSEIRAYNEGLIIVEQIPSKLLNDIIKNTSTKIVHKTIDGQDRKLIRDSLVLNEEQTDELPFLKPGECIYIDEALHMPQKVLVNNFIEQKFDRINYLKNFEPINVKIILGALTFSLIEQYKQSINPNSFNSFFKELNSINMSTLNNEIIALNIINSLIIREGNLFQFEQCIDNNKVISWKETGVFLILESDIVNSFGKALAWSFVFSKITKNYLLGNKVGKINDLITIANDIEKYIFLSLLCNINKSYKSEKENLILKIHNFIKTNLTSHDNDYCDECNYSAKYAFLINNMKSDLYNEANVSIGSKNDLFQLLSKSIRQKIFCDEIFYKEYIDCLSKLNYESD